MDWHCCKCKRNSHINGCSVSRFSIVINFTIWIDNPSPFSILAGALWEHKIEWLIMRALHLLCIQFSRFCKRIKLIAATHTHRVARDKFPKNEMRQQFNLNACFIQVNIMCNYIILFLACTCWLLAAHMTRALHLKWEGILSKICICCIREKWRRTECAFALWIWCSAHTFRFCFHSVNQKHEIVISPPVCILWTLFVFFFAYAHAHEMNPKRLINRPDVIGIYAAPKFEPFAGRRWREWTALNAILISIFYDECRNGVLRTKIR